MVTGEKCLVADTAAFLAGTHLQATTPVYTVAEVLEEVRDQRSRRLLQLAVEADKIIVEQPPHEAVRQAIHHASQIGTRRSLSATDIAILALAIHLKQTRTCNPILVTDDYKLQKTAGHAGIEYRPVKTPGLPPPAKHK